MGATYSPHDSVSAMGFILHISIVFTLTAIFWKNTDNIIAILMHIIRSKLSFVSISKSSQSSMFY